MTDNAPTTLRSYNFVVLNLAALFAFCNIAVFYSFAAHLESIAVPAAWRGLLLGLEPMAASPCAP